MRNRQQSNLQSNGNSSELPTQRPSSADQCSEGGNCIKTQYAYTDDEGRQRFYYACSKCGTIM